MNFNHKSQNINKNFGEIPWIEKYRPRSLDQVVGNLETISRLQEIISTKIMPNMIMTGPPGVGKTTSIRCIAKALLGKEYSQATLTINASDKNGVGVVRENISFFAKRKMDQKIIILEEADNMTKDALHALGEIMDKHSQNTRFALLCNSYSDIIEPIQSRCTVFRFGKLSNSEIIKRIKLVIEKEKIPIDINNDKLINTIEFQEITGMEEGIKALVYSADGDMRNALNNLQAIKTSFGILNLENVYKLCDIPNIKLLQKLINLILTKQLNKALDLLLDLSNQGYAPVDVIQTLLQVLVSHNMTNQGLQLKMIKEMGATHYAISEGVDTYLQLAGLMGRWYKIVGDEIC